MIDDEEWQRHCSEYDAALATHRPIPPQLRELHAAMFRARIRQHQNEIDRIFAEAANDPEAMARLKQARWK